MRRVTRVILALGAAALVATAGSIAYVASLVPRPHYNAQPVPVGPAPDPAQTWSHFAGDAGATQFSPADQITPANAGRLEVAWTTRAGGHDTMKTTPGDYLVAFALPK